jgi:hypothetical protein
LKPQLRLSWRMSKLSDAPCRHQQCFSGLDVKVDDDIESFNSFTSSFSGSTSSFSGSLSSRILGSVSGVLSSAMVSALTFNPEDYHRTAHTASEDLQNSRCPKSSAQQPNSSPNSTNTESRSSHQPKPHLSRSQVEPIDFEWLRERCGGDNQLVLEVLQSFCEQGQHHLNAIQSCIREHDTKRLIFHSVSICLISWFLSILCDPVAAEFPRGIGVQYRG